jgi:hypothetical protein
MSATKKIIFFGKLGSDDVLLVNRPSVRTASEDAY